MPANGKSCISPPTTIRAVTGELDKAARDYQEEIESYPRTHRAHVDLGDQCMPHRGSMKKLRKITRQALRLAPDHVTPYDDLANYTLALQRFDETRQTIHEAQARKLDNFILHNALYALAFSGRILQRWRNSNSGLRASPKRTLDWRSHPTPKHMLVIWARQGN